MFYTFPLLGTIFAPMALFYYVSAMYYRRSSVEVKRLDSILRSGLYASYSGTQAFYGTYFLAMTYAPNFRNPHWSFHCSRLSLTGMLLCQVH